MSQSGLESSARIRKHGNCSIWWWQISEALKANPLCFKLGSQQVGNADIDLGKYRRGVYGRRSRIESVA